MDLIDRFRELSAKIPKLKEHGTVTTEEGVKNALVMPFINALGYNVFDPTEVTPELTADVGTKKGEKVDYAIIKDGKPIMLFECKGFDVDLNNVHASQLYRYFSVTAARFGVLTNGVEYQFFSDLDEPNKMDDRPFFIFDLTEVTESDAESLKRFSKSRFDLDVIVDTASELKYTNAIKQFMHHQLANPSESFVRLCLDDVYNGRFTQNVLERFIPITKSALKAFVNEQVGNRLKTALASEDMPAHQSSSEEPTETVEEVIEEVAASDVETTQEELDAYFAIKGIVREVIDAKRVTMRDVKTYCSILIDDNNRRLLCRLWFNRSQKYLGLVSEDKEEEKIPIEEIDDIFQYADQLKARVKSLSE